jgi:hypothetical protein
MSPESCGTTTNKLTTSNQESFLIGPSSTAVVSVESRPDAHICLHVGHERSLSQIAAYKLLLFPAAFIGADQRTLGGKNEPHSH